ncbi:universal stress protein [Halomarina rubra]|uniref:Universal stress protein n=1 Tax=Halomarina rubra TaxID=2071873 RepID=A0ABD6B0Y8_9EURY|nr:universal stress protein [Halomarina rubra]
MSRTASDGDPSAWGVDRANALVSVEGAAADRELVRAAGRYVAWTGGRLTVLNVMPSGAFADRRHARERLAGFGRFTLAQAETERRCSAEYVAREALEGVPVEYDCVGVVGREPDRILVEASERACGHVFLSDRRRSSLGAVGARDVVDEVVEAFEGTVTVLRDLPDSESRQVELV